MVIDYSVHSTTKLMIGQVRWLGGSLAGFLFPLHACLFQLSLLADMVELKLKLPLSLIIQERRPSTPFHSIFPCCLDHHGGKDGTDRDAKDEVSHRFFCCAPFYLETPNYHRKIAWRREPSDHGLRLMEPLHCNRSNDGYHRGLF
mgnify:CR=1 FL=1